MIVRILARTRTVLFFVFIAAMIAGLLSYSAWGDRLPVEDIKEYVNASDWAPWIFILIYVGLSVFFPTTPMMALAGILFGFGYGLFYTSIAGLTSAIFTFVLARALGRKFVDNLLEQKRSLELLEKYDSKMSEHGITTVVVLRIMPIMPFNVLNLLMGISKVNFRDYTIGTLLGLAPSNVLAVYFGSLILSLALREFSLYLAILLVAGLIVLAYFRLLFVWSYFKKGKKE